LPRVKRSYTRRAVKEVKEVKAVAKRGGISEAGRKSLAEAMKKRWAAKRAGTAVKKARKKATAKKAE
jgi:butyrate kinase